MFNLTSKPCVKFRHTEMQKEEFNGFKFLDNESTQIYTKHRYDHRHEQFDTSLRPTNEKGVLL